ncbi:Cof-type HAD-IIB family hydrolase [Caloranaerobacter azorensis]|uniref:HAD family phosphatase n=1 Tax=Caloranaerobacter azorensis TaxID=116090 RepID=A0A6P1YG58_9FIRM|nr:Cof-type HAD-IIB family hydrolase [Caloranaerobacter azorensis]QIB26906.1 HAD family phosphatase [Caloranaerobacter azorensis]
MYKLLALDMDGTLLNKEHKISRENFEAIQEALHMGVKVVLASGRIFGGMLSHLKQLNLVNDDNYSVSCTGGLVLNNTMSKIIQSNGLSIDDLKYVYGLTKELNLSLNIYTRDSILAFQDDIFSRFDAIANNVPLKIVDINSLRDDIEIYKMTIINDSIDVIMEAREFLEKLCPKDIIQDKCFKDIKRLECDVLDKISVKISDKYTVVKPLQFALEVINKDCNKWTGIKKIAEELGIQNEEIICIGDSENDEHMIKNAGLGVAMGNGFSKIKEIADYVTYTNDQHGVAHVINKFILGKEIAYAED